MNTFSLLGKGGEKNDCLFSLPDRPIGIGTDPDKCSIIYLQDKNNISAFHCQLVPRKGGWILTDYSDKGTWLNGKKMTPFQAYRLKPGDVFYLASLENSFYFSVENTASSNSGQTQNPQWQPPNQNLGQTQNPQWSSQNQNLGQIQNPQWSSQNQNLGQTRNPQWSSQNQNLGQTQEFDIKEKFLSYKGRLDRQTYIIRGFYLSVVNFILWFIATFIFTLVKPSGDTAAVMAVAIIALLVLVMIVPGTMLAIRRLHDLDKSGWYNFLAIIPIVGGIYLLYLLFTKEGTHGVNRFGAEYHYQAPVNPTQREFEEKYLTFEGRLNRKPFILRWLILLVSSFVIGFVTAFILTVVGATENDITLITQIAAILFMYPFPTLCIRRLHDLDKSGWFYLVLLVPIVNLVFLLYLIFAKGTVGANQYGSDPLV